jgi:amidase
VVEWKPYKHTEIYDTLVCFFLSFRIAVDPPVQRGIWGAGAAEDFATVAAISGEPVIESMELSDEEVAAVEASFRPGSNSITAYKVWQVQKRKAELRREYLKYWNDTASTTGTGRPVDAIISPMASYAAPPHGLNKWVPSLSLSV